MIAVVDYGAGNLYSVCNSLRYLGIPHEVTADPESLREADGVILPGVGSFGDAMGKLRAYGLEEVIRKVIERGTPFLGICLGLQLLFEESEEAPGVPGLGILKGRIRKIPDGAGLNIPHIGWNSL